MCSRLGNIHRPVVQHVACDCQGWTVIKMHCVGNLPLWWESHFFLQYHLLFFFCLMSTMWSPGIIMDVHVDINTKCANNVCVLWIILTFQHICVEGLSVGQWWHSPSSKTHTRADWWTHRSTFPLPCFSLLVCSDLIYAPCFCQTAFISSFVHLPLTPLHLWEKSSCKRSSLPKRDFFSTFQTTDREPLY